MGQARCRACGVAFTSGLDGKWGGRVYCSPECAKANRICIRCGKSFAPNAPAQRFCSSNCQQVHKVRTKHRKRGGVDDPQAVELRCEGCGAIFQKFVQAGSGRRQRLCSQCIGTPRDWLNENDFQLMNRKLRVFLRRFDHPGGARWADMLDPPDLP
jgi:hypothetical protein